MALDFPANPTNGQAYSNFIYSSSKGAWQAKPQAGPKTATGDVPPANPVNGDQWFNTSDGTLYIYVTDVDTSQWVEHRSEIARSQVGLVPIRPTGLTVGSGTASSDINGTITFTGCNYFDVANVFSSSFANYHVLFEDVKATAADSLLAYVLLNNTTANGSNFTYQRIYAQNSGIGTVLSSGSSAGGIGVITSLDCSARMTIYRPNKAQYTNSQSETIYVRNESGVMKPFIEQHYATLADTVAYNGIRFYDPAGSITGKVKIYGYN